MLGAQLLSSPAGATHVVFGDERQNRFGRALAKRAGARLVHYHWVTQSLQDGAPQAEDAFPPPFATPGTRPDSPGPLRVRPARARVTVLDVQALVLFLCDLGPAPACFSVEGERPRTLLLLQAQGWDAAGAGPACAELGLEGRVEFPCQALSGLVSMAQGLAKRKRAAAAEEQSEATASSRIPTNPPLPLDWHLATGAQMRLAGYPGYALQHAASQQQRARERADPWHDLVAAPLDHADTELFPRDLPTQARLLAIDCEMVITGRGFELARVTAVDGDMGAARLDALVAPDAPVLDHNTRYSGISAATLAGVTTRVPDVWRLLEPVLGPQTVLVGHTLENDLGALKLVHRRCLDTSMLYPDPRGPGYRPSLRALAARFLDRRIQTGEHDSAEDARAALDLARLRLERGAGLGCGGDQLFLRLLGGEDGKAGARERSLFLVDRPHVLARHAPANTQGLCACSSDEHALAELKAALKGDAAAVTREPECGSFEQSPSRNDADEDSAAPQRIVFGAFRDLEAFQERRAARLRIHAPSDVPAALTSTMNAEELEELGLKLDKRVRELLAALPENSAAIVFSSGRDAALCR